MRSTFAGWIVAMGVLCGVTYGQNAPPAVQPRQPAPPPTRQPLQPPNAAQPGQPTRAVQPAQDQPRLAQPGQQLARQGGQSTSADQQIAALIFACCHNEVEVSKFAQSKLQSAEARAFAEKMVAHHTPDCESYQRWAGKQAASTALKPDDEAPAAELRAGQPGAPRQPGAAGLAVAPVAAGGADWMTIHEQIAKQCLESTKQELGRHQGSEFDKCYMGQQLAGHMKIQDELKVLRNHVSPELQQQIDKSLQVAQGHLQEARQIMEQLKDSPSERVSRKPDNK
jgi:predicted outer membrane protein